MGWSKAGYNEYEANIHYQNHVEVYLRYLILQLHLEDGTRIFREVLRF